METHYQSVCGDSLYYLGRGLYASVNTFQGKTLFHIRNHFCPELGTSNAEIMPKDRINILKPTRKGICLDEDGWRQLFNLKQRLDADYNASTNQEMPDTPPIVDSKAGTSGYLKRPMPAKLKPAKRLQLS